MANPHSLLAVTERFGAHLFVRLLLREDTLHGIGASARPQPLDLLEARYRMLHACHDSHIAVLIEWVWAVGHVLEYSRTSADYEG